MVARSLGEGTRGAGDDGLRGSFPVTFMHGPGCSKSNKARILISVLKHFGEVFLYILFVF